MLEEMADNGVTLTAEDTVAARMKAILDGGLAEATFSCFLDVTGAYEDWNEVLVKHQFPRQPGHTRTRNFSCL